MDKAELDKQVRADTEEVQFDTHGMTDKCPHYGNAVSFNDCQKCCYFRGHDGFTVYCKYSYIMGVPKELSKGGN